MVKDMSCEEKKIKYFEKNAIPYLLAHLNMRSLGLQIFTAVQGALMLAWATKPNIFFAVVGFAGCLSFFLWDSRNRYIFNRLHELGEEVQDKPIFGVADNDRAKKGIHRMFRDTLGISRSPIPWATNRILFSLEDSYQELFDRTEVSKIRHLFERNSYPLSENVQVNVIRKSVKWRVYDQDNKIRYYIKKTKTKLEIARRLSGIASHTWAIRIMIVIGALVWTVLILYMILHSPAIVWPKL
jgi:hypothetical protein